MSKFQQIDMIGGQAIDVNSTTQNHQLGLTCKAVDTASTDYGVGEFVYAKGAASTAIGSVCQIDATAYATDLAVANDKGMTKKELNDQSVEVYGCVIDYLTRQNASSLIDSMLAN